MTRINAQLGPTCQSKYSLFRMCGQCFFDWGGGADIAVGGCGRACTLAPELTVRRAVDSDNDNDNACRKIYSFLK